MNTFLLSCLFFWGEVTPNLTSTEKRLITNCQKTYVDLKQCEAAKAPIVKFNETAGKREGAAILTSCTISE